MCGRFTQQRDPAEIAQAFDAELDAEAEVLGAGRYNVAPTDPVVAVVAHEGRRRLTAFRWGLVPPWAADTRGAARLINARAETVTSTPAFRVALRRRRCLIPADGFYEWRREGTRRLPYLLRARDGRPLAFAGLWSLWREPDGDDWLRTCSIVTSAANRFIAPLHHRMPVSLPKEAWSHWLDPTLTDAGALRALLEPSPEDLLEAVPLAPLVNDVRRQGPELVEPIGPRLHSLDSLHGPTDDRLPLA
ncbi:MAG TPA: SOS response-associated peptidase [Candidatus Limnocylindrales bacterium]|nr:SOS response-associated peptidase [Candidatus Limnocylindrales bacterium]